MGGPEACAVVIPGNTPDELVKNCQEHVMAEIEKGDDAHQEAVENMQGMSPDEQQEQMAEYLRICTDAFTRS